LASRAFRCLQEKLDRLGSMDELASATADADKVLVI
jgi:hypothetical protein